jgi:hypothetical protein
MPQTTWHWSLSLHIPLFSAGIGVVDGAGPSDFQHRIRAFKTSTPIPLDDDPAKCRGADTVTFEGKPLAIHPGHATVNALWDKEKLYRAFDVRSSKLQASVREHDGDKLWEGDGVEFPIGAMSHRTKNSCPTISPITSTFSIRHTMTGAHIRGSPTLSGTALRNTQCQSWVIITMSHRHRSPGRKSALNRWPGHTFISIDFGVNGKDPETGAYDYFDWCGLKVFP